MWRLGDGGQEFHLHEAHRAALGKAGGTYLMEGISQNAENHLTEKLEGLGCPWMEGLGYPLSGDLGSPCRALH